MRLYDGGRAPNPRRVQIFLKEKGINIERVQLDLNRHEPRSPEFAAINPMMTVPVLVLDDGTAIAETVAICRYFEETHPEPPLMGVGAIEKAVIEMWQRRVELYLFLPVGMAFRHLHPGGAILEGEQVGRWGEINQERARKFMGFLDDELRTREFIAGSHFTIADITALVAYQFLKPAKIAYPEDMPHLQRWYQQVSARPACAIEA